MRRITLWIVGTVCGLILLFSYTTSAGIFGDSDDNDTQDASGGDTTDTTTSSSSTTTASSGASAASGTTYDGDVVETRYGDVQVQVVISGGEIVDVVALQTPGGDRKNIEINNRAVPVLRQAVLDAQSADIDSVSGATYTSEAYVESLQSALDAANFS